MTVFFPSPLDLRVMDGPSRDFMLLADFPVMVNGRTFTVPKGFHTDFATVPSALQNIIENDDPCITKASVGHDYLYSLRGAVGGDFKDVWTRAQADDFLRDGMTALNAPMWKRDAVWAGVRAGGEFYWNQPITPTAPIQ